MIIDLFELTLLGFVRSRSTCAPDPETLTRFVTRFPGRLSHDLTYAFPAFFFIALRKDLERPLSLLESDPLLTYHTADPSPVSCFVVISKGLGGGVFWAVVC